jgi:YD repeat-containing protein
VQITNGNQQTAYAYNSQGDITQKTVTDLSANTTRSWNTAYTYSSAVPGVLLQKVEDGPRTDVSDLTTYDYYPADATCQGGHFGCRGQLKQITDALGHSTQLSRYSANGQLEEFTDPNGLVTTLTYDVRQRLTSLDVGGETTRYSYDPAGQITRVTRPDGAYLAYSYDPAQRLIKTQDDQGNTLSYTLDALGNRIKEEAHDPNGQLARSQSRVYDALSRLQNLVQAQ